MINLPAGFDAALFVSELYYISMPIITIVVLMTAFVLIAKILKRL